MIRPETQGEGKKSGELAADGRLDIARGRTGFPVGVRTKHPLGAGQPHADCHAPEGPEAMTHTTTTHAPEAGGGDPAAPPSLAARTAGSIAWQQTGAVETHCNECRGEIDDVRERLAHLGGLLEGLRPGNPTHLPGRESPHARPGTPTAPPRRTPRFPALARAALALLAVLAAAPAAAQTVTTLVSNIGQTQVLNSWRHGRACPALHDRVQHGRLHALQHRHRLHGCRGQASFAVSIYTTNASGHPDTLVASLTAPGTFPAGTLTFTAPASTTLAASTVYTLRVTPGSNAVTFSGRVEQCRRFRRRRGVEHWEWLLLP